MIIVFYTWPPSWEKCDKNFFKTLFPLQWIFKLTKKNHVYVDKQKLKNYHRKIPFFNQQKDTMTLWKIKPWFLELTELSMNCICVILDLSNWSAKQYDRRCKTNSISFFQIWQEFRLNLYHINSSVTLS